MNVPESPNHIQPFQENLSMPFYDKSIQYYVVLGICFANINAHKFVSMNLYEMYFSLTTA